MHWIVTVRITSEFVHRAVPSENLFDYPLTIINDSNRDVVP